jgi:3-oxoacyl-[acyl-carrier protein] reductase
MIQSLVNKTALVCGSTQGIGMATAVKLSSMGANLVLIARDETKLKNTLAELETSEGQKHTYLVADFTKPTELKTIISDYINAGNKINILINITCKNNTTNISPSALVILIM